MTNDVTTGEDLAALEGIIERGLATFIEVGRALLTIREGRLYREAGYTDFDSYCRQRWGWSRVQAHRQIEAARVVELLPMGNTPANERQIRELAPLKHDPVRLGEAWHEAQERFGDKPTAAEVRQVVAEVLPELGPAPAAPAPQPSVHFSSESSEWYTPGHIIERVTDCLGGIDLDPCSNSHEAPNVPAARHYTAQDDGLARPWRGRVYMNPPYGREIEPWVKRLVEQVAAGTVTAAIALLPARTETGWFRLLRDYPVCFLDGRLKFSGHDNSAPFPSALFYLGPDWERFLRTFADIGDVYRRITRDGTLRL